MNYKKISIKTKFVSLLSILMAFVLAIQYYFTAQTQSDIMEEFDRISSSMKKATEVHFLQNLPRSPVILSEKDTLLQKNIKEHEKTLMQSMLRSRDIQALVEHADSLPFIYRAKDDKELDILLKNVKHFPVDSVGRNIRDRQRHFTTNYSFSGDSLAWVLEEVEVNLEHPDKEAERSRYKTDRKQVFTERIRKPPSFEFVVPDFTELHTPRIMRFNYNTGQLQEAVEKVRNRNILITLTIFSLSIGAIVLMTRKILKPIDRLQSSFDDVVQGNLEINLKPDTRDEIGDLTRSFNHMVLELKKNKEKEVLLQRKERLASLGQLAAGVAHEVKNPLNAINLTIDHLKDKFINKDDGQAVKYIQSIQSEIRRLDKIVNNFFNYLRSEELERKKTDINRMLKEIVKLFEREMDTNNIKTDINLHGKFILEIDEGRMKTALMNIILNAIQAMSAGGLLTIDVNKIDKSIVIKDTGRGIESREADHVFDLFYTTKTSGSGLGLPTAYKVIKAHGGDITINSQPGQGTSVLIQLQGVSNGNTDH